MISFMPSMALMGVRISWDMLARKSLLAAFARSAASFAPCSCWLKSIWSSTLLWYWIMTKPVKTMWKKNSTGNRVMMIGA